MKKNQIVGASLILVILGALSFSFSNTSNKFVNQAVALGSYSTNASTYYSSISTTSTGNTLGKELHNLMISTHQTYTTYGDIRNYFKYVDTDPSNSSNILCFWRRTSMSGTWDSGATWNREHVWCQSLSSSLWSNTDNNTQGGGADILHVRPASSDANSERSNSKYAELATWSSQTATGFFNETFMPNDDVKGDVARILMYTFIHYSTSFGGTTNSYTGSLNITNIVNGSSASEAWQTLLMWNYEDPVDSFEQQINNNGSTYQGNRNPFIDNPDYAPRIWDSTGNYYTTSIGIVSPSNLTIDAGSTGSAAAEIRNGSGNITYSIIDGAQYASVNSSTGVVTGLAAGYATVQASVTIGGNTYTDITTVKVTKSVSDTYELVKSSSTALAAGDEIVFVYNDSGTYIAMQAATLSSYYMNATAVTISGSYLNVTDSCGIWTVGKSNSSFTFYNSSFGGYLRGYKSGSYSDMGCATSTNTSGALWTVTTTSSGVSTVVSNAGIYFQGDSSWPEFKATSSSTSVYIYRKVVNSINDAKSLTITGNTNAIPFGCTLTDKIAVTVTYNNNQTDDVTSAATYSSHNTKALGQQSLTVSYGALSTSLTINVTNVGANSSNFTASEQASAYNDFFLAKTYGNCSNATVWSLLKTEYNAMTSSSISTFILEFNSSGDYSDAYNRYQIALAAHGMEDFMNQGVAQNSLLLNLITDNKIVIIFAVGFGLCAISFFAVRYLLKKKKVI